MNLGEIIKRYKQITFPFLQISKKNYKYSTSVQISHVQKTEIEKEVVGLK